ncbi:MAG: class I SAM-dependent methyltransferase [bacterium]
MLKKKNNYIPALLFDFLTPFYDFIVNTGIPVSLLNNELVKHANIMDNYNILDIGCGTGTLIIDIKKKYPGTEVTGLDGDPKILKIAEKKIKRNNLSINLVQGMSYSLPYADNSFDRVLSSLMAHHLDYGSKTRTFAEVLRVLKPGGEFLLLDIGKPENIFMLVLSQFFNLLEESSENIKGILPKMIENAGFYNVEVVYTRSTIIGSLSMIKGTKILK